MSTLGRNIAFPIYNGDGTSFHNLVIKKSTSDSIVMSLGDKVTGDVYYKDNTLECNMDEYILVDGVKYSIVNPPTIVREGLKSENGDLKGMTKYSFEFYHPMYMLGNMAFSDVAVTNAESMFKSHDRTFSWIGNLTDYVAKLNKNLQDTQFIVSISSSIDADSRKVLSDVLSFTNNTIADALKTAYDTWHFPFVVDAIKSGEQYYNQGKRFLIQFGNPTREILDSNNQPFVFHFGKGVGLKNNSRTPRNNKIVTRVAGYGSEQNIPYGYPQIPWTGDPSATQTADGYPIYEGIVGGVVTKLVKHPFTRTHLMPSVYAESVRKKVDSAAVDYDNTTPLVDYYDAPSTYPNPINLAAPKLDIVGIETIKPELGDMAILGVTPLNNDLTPASGWDDTMDDDGNYTQSYFKITLPQLDFDIYACASITEEMKINMRSGACIGCTFDAQVDWDDYKKNFFDAQGNFLPNGEQRNLTKYPKSNDGSIDLIVKKDLNTYGTLMPNVYQKPLQGDKFVVLGISMPSTYITNAEERLDAALMTHMLDNNVYYYDYPLKFDEDFFYNHTDILSQVRPNSVLRFTFGGVEKSLYIKQITIKYGEGVLPKYDITLTDNIEVVLNQIGLVADDVSRLAMAMMQMNKRTNINISNTESLQKYVDYTIMPNLESIQKQIDGSQVTYFGNENPFDASQPYSDGKYVVDPTKFPASEWDDDYSEHDGDMFYNRDSGKGYEFTIIDNSTSPVVYGWQLIQDEDIIQALTNAQNAQDTADGKRRVFICDASHHTPNPPYDVGDLWVNVKYPYATGATYDDEILKCVVAKTEDQTFDISDWSLANGYTAALRNFINGTYADNLQEIQTQIDGKAETWYQNTDPSTAWTTTALKNQHKGDIWHNSSTSTINGVKAGQDAIWNGTAWVVDETVPQAIYDEIDGKCAIYVAWGAWGNDLQEKDLFIPAADTTQGGVTYKANKVYRCVDKDTPTFQEIAYTDDTQYNGFITKLIGSSGQTKDAAENAIAAIKHALSDGNTYNEGGLILSNLISLGTGSPTSGTFTPWAGISGIYKTSETGTGYKGHGIAAWFGGGMIDKEVSAVSNAAKSLFRFDGSGYVASGNLSWDKNGNVTIQGYSINATTLQVGGSNVATQAMLDNFVSKAFFNRLFTAYDANGNAIVPNNTTTAINNLKIMVGAWTEQYLSALGLNSEGGGGGGTGDVSHIKIGTNPDVFLDPDEDGIIDMSSYAANWNDAYNKRHTHSNKSVLDGITSTKVSHWDAVYGVVPSAAYESGNQLADKNFVNSSISTATATFRGTVTASNDTDAAAATALATISTKDLNDYAFVKVENTPQTGVDKYKRYKYNGSSWVYEYTLNNSSFTSDQWNAINSGITTSLVTKLNGIASGAQVNVLESVKVNGTALSISSKAVDITAVPLTIITGADDLKAIEGLSGTSGFLKKTAANTWALDTTVVLSTRKVSTGNGLQGGGDLSADRTLSILLPANSGLSVASTGLKLDIVNNLTTASDYRAISATQAKKIWDLLNQMFTLEGAGTTASPYVIKANYGLYTEQFLSALGQNSQGGGGGGMGEDEMWAALQANSGTYENAKINWNHIPLATTSTAGAIKVGSTLAISNGILNQATIPNFIADVYTKVTIDTYGRVTQGGSLLADDIPTLSMSKISGLSTALDNVYTKTESDGKYVTAIGTNGNYLTYTKNGNSNSITVPYATTANSLKNLYNYSTRPTSANLTHINNGGVQHFLATSSMATNKPANDGHILHFHWDTTAGWDSQLFLSNDPSKPFIQYRAENGDNGRWGSWITVLDTNNTYVNSGKGYINGTEITTISGNAGSATKLQTARTIWGQSFDGTANVNGAFRAKKDLGGNLADWVQKQHDGVFEVGRATNTMCVTIGVTDDNWGYIQTKGNGITTPGNLALNPGGGTVYINSNVGIGTSSPSYKLHINGTLGVSGAASIGSTLTMGGGIIMPNNTSIAFKDTHGNHYSTLFLGGDNTVHLGYSTSAAGYKTYISGSSVYLRYGTSGTVGLTLDSSGVVSIAGATNIAGLLSANGNVKTTKLYLYKPNSDDTNAVYLTYDSTNSGIHVVGAGLYSDSYVSALGSNSEGGGSGAGLEDVWDSLTNQQGTVITDNTKIAIAHIPDTSSTYGYLKSSALNGYATQTWVNQQGFLTTHQSIYALTLKADGTAVTTFTPNSADASLDFVAGTNISLTRGTNQITIANTYSYTLPLAASGTRGGVQIGYSESNSGTSTTRNYAVKLSSEKMYVNVPWTDTTYKLTLNGTTNGASGGTSLGSFYAPTAVGTANQVLISGGSGTAPSWTAQSNLSVGTAAKLGTGTTTYSAWGVNYWENGVPKSISGNMTSVGSITPSANGNALGTTSARFNIYGTSGNFSGNVSISGTLGVTGATTLTGLLTANGGIVVPSTKTIKIGDCTISWDSTNSMLKFDTGIYSTGAVSALGANSSGGGSGTFDEEAMWAALDATNEVIASSHIPNLSASKITSGTFAAARIPIATASAVGGIKVGTTLAISDGVLNQKSGIATAGTYRSVTVDTYGRVTAGTNPTTLSGYGISDAYTKTQVDNALGGYLNRKTYSLAGKTAVRITFNNVNGGIISARVTKQSGSLVLIGNGYGEGGTTRNNWVQISESTTYFSWCIPTASGIEKSVEIYNNDTTTASIVVASFDTDVTFTELSALSTTASTVKVAYASSLEDYLPLTGGTVTGILEVNNIQSTSGNGLLAYHPSAWEGASNTQWGVGSVDSQGVIRSNNSNLLHYKGGTSYTILDSSNYSSYALPLSGGEMTGPLTWKNATALSGVTSTNYVLCIDGFADGGTTHYITTANLSVGSATKATQDGSGRTITSTYLTDIGINSNNNLTQTKNGTASLVGNLLERNHTVRYNLSATGWYRIGTFMNTLNQGNVCFLLVRREYNSQNNESYIFAITTGYSGAITISQLSGQANIHQMTKIRVDYVNNASTKPAIDIYMSTANQNNYAFTIIGSAQLSNTATLNPTLIGSQYEYSTVSGMGTSRNFTAVGEVTASSDARLKTIVGDATLSLKDIANAPNVLFRWNDGRDDKVHGGSIAQYWLQKASQFVGGDENGFYSLNYGALATSMAISIAKEVVRHEDEITRLKKVVAKQAGEIVELKNKVRELEERRA